MSQATFDDDDLFGEAAEEMRAEVEDHLASARADLPAADDVWETDADNVLGVLNGLKTALDAGEAVENLRQAKKSYVMGERADAFEDADDLAEEIEDLEALIETVEATADQVGELTSTIPALRGDLEDAAADGDDDDDTAADGGEDTAADSGEDTAADGGEDAAADGGEDVAADDENGSEGDDTDDDEEEGE